MSGLAHATLGVAANDAQRHVQEEGGNNTGPRVREYLRGCQPPINVAAPWCAAFVQFCSDVAAGHMGVPNPLDDVKREAYVLDYYTWASDNGLLVPASQAQPGDLILFRFSAGPNRWNHIGIVARPPTRNWSVWTIEGNTSPGVGSRESEAQREGDGVYLKQRELDASYQTAIVRWAE